MKTSSFWSEKNKSRYQAAVDKLIAEIKELDKKYFDKTGNHFIRFVESRLKDPESIANKLKRKNKLDVEDIASVINDLAGVRVICFDTKQIYKLARMIGECSQFEVIKIKDYVRKQKDNGYQSYHIILNIDGVKVELQIRTILMDAWSSLDGILIYKKSVPISDEMKNDIKKFAKWSRKMDKMVTKLMQGDATPSVIDASGQSKCKKM